MKMKNKLIETRNYNKKLKFTNLEGCFIVVESHINTELTNYENSEIPIYKITYKAWLKDSQEDPKLFDSRKELIDWIKSKVSE